MSAVLARPDPVLPSRFGYLMGLYAENFHRLNRLFPLAGLLPGVYHSSVDDGMDVHLAVHERQPWTMDLELSYALIDHATGLKTPSAQLRVYLDARVAEAMHCEPGKCLWQVLGPLPRSRTVMQHRLRMASFLNRWLEYLAEQGHSQGTLAPAVP
ncbi:MAG TPA: DUF1249 domain-containing protein [Rhodanobacteraceae bacterium]|nr:DUF1249 domain-containing protein [Rhodanobacteraceae bacterium]